MEGTRATWTDELMGDLSRRVDDGFGRLDRRIESTERRIDSLDTRIATFQTTILQLGGGMTVAILATLVSVLISNT